MVTLPLSPESDAGHAVTTADERGRMVRWQAVQAHLDEVYGFVFGAVGQVALAEDITQDVFEIAWSKVAQLRDARRARAWLMSIAANEVRRHFRRRRPSVPWGSETEHRLGAADDFFAAIDERGVVARTLRRLSPTDRLVLLLHGLQGYAHAEVAEILSIRESTAQKRWQRARARFIRESQEVEHDRA